MFARMKKKEEEEEEEEEEEDVENGWRVEIESAALPSHPLNHNQQRRWRDKEIVRL